MTDQPCPLCERPITDATICSSCADGVGDALRDVIGHRQHHDPDVRTEAHPDGVDHPRRWVPGLLDSLDVALSRQARISIGPTANTRVLTPQVAVDDANDTTGSTRHGTSARVQPLPYGVAASAVRARLARAISNAAAAVGWVLVADDSPTVKARWLAAHLEQLRHHPDAARHAEAIWAAVDKARQVIDRPADARYAGSCEETGPAWQVVAHARTVANAHTAAARAKPVPAMCDGQLYAEDGAEYVRCPTCGTQHEVQAQRDRLLDRAEDRLASVGVLAALLSEPGREVTRKMLDGYVERGRLLAHAHETRGGRRVALYRVADARVLVAARRRKVAG